MSQWFDRFLHRLSGVKTSPTVSSSSEETRLSVPSPSLPSWNSRRSVPFRNKAGPAYPFGLDEPLVWFSPQDPWTLRDACEGCQIIGDTGSGKTTGSGQALAKGFLRLGLGGLVLTHKSDDRQRWEQYCRDTGRLGIRNASV